MAYSQPVDTRNVIDALCVRRPLDTFEEKSEFLKFSIAKSRGQIVIPNCSAEEYLNVRHSSSP